MSNFGAFSFFNMKIFAAIFLMLAGSFSVPAQDGLQDLVKTEKAFASAAAEKGTRSAFLEFLAPDSIVFNPERASGIEVWTARKENPALLSWYPSFADISSSGSLGYTTGPWEYRPKGKDDTPSAFGHFVTVWQKQPNGQFKAVLDIGIDHARPNSAEPEFAAGTGAASAGETSSYAGDSAARFFELVSSSGPEKAYKEFAANDVRLLRDNEPPFVGKKNALAKIGKQKGKLAISKRMSFFGSGDLAYATNSYTLTQANGKVEKGNFVQIWKFRDKRWQIVLDIFAASSK